MQGHKYSHICNLWGKVFPAGMICTTTDTISIPLGEMYLHARMFCALSHASSISMGAINFYMQERFLHSVIPLLFPCSNVFYSHGCNVMAWNLFWAIVAKLVLWQLIFIALYTRSYVFFSHGCNVFIHARTFFTLLYPWWAQIFIVITEVWPRANRAMGTW